MIKTKDAGAHALNWAISIIQGVDAKWGGFSFVLPQNPDEETVTIFNPANSPAFRETHHIDTMIVDQDNSFDFVAMPKVITVDNHAAIAYGPTPEIAAARLYVMMAGMTEINAPSSVLYADVFDERFRLSNETDTLKMISHDINVLDTVDINLLENRQFASRAIDVDPYSIIKFSEDVQRDPRIWKKSIGLGGGSVYMKMSEKLRMDKDIAMEAVANFHDMITFVPKEIREEVKTSLHRRFAEVS